MTILSKDDLDSFTDRVDEASILIDGLKNGKLPIEYVDKRIEEV